MALTITIPGAVEATIGATAPAVLTIGVGTPGATGPQGPAGSPGVGVPAGGTAGQFLTKTTTGVDYATNWSTLSLTGYATESWVTAGFYPLSGNPSGFLTASSLTPYLSKAGNLAGLNSLSDARDNLNLGTANTPVFSGVTAQGSGANVGQFTPTSLTLTHATYGSFTIQPSQGIVFPDATIQTTAYPGPVGATAWGTITGTLSSQTDLQSALNAKLSSASAATTYAVIAAGQPTSGTVGQVLTKNSGTNYDSSWATLIPGDRYLTTSTTSNTISNGNKTFTVGTGLSYSSQQDVVIAYDAANHMHALVTSYNSGTGVLVVDVQHHTGSGTYSSWTVNVGGTTPLQSVEWGEILGTLGDQADLATALNAKLETSTAATTYAPIASPTFTGTVTIPAGASISGFAPLASPALTGNVTITSNSTGSALFIEQAGVGNILTLHDQATDTNFVAIDANGKVSTIPSEATNGAGFNIAHGVAPTTPVNGDIWTTTTGLFARINASTKQMMTLSDTQTVSGGITFTSVNQTLGNSTGAGVINVASGATLTALTKTVNVGTGGVVGSTTNTTIGPVLGASTTSIGGTTAASTLNLATGATLTATTKAVNIGTSGVAGSTTTIAIGSTTGTSTTTLQGNVTASGTNLDLGNSTAASQINLGSGATISGATKTVSIGNGGASGSTTNVTIANSIGAPSGVVSVIIGTSGGVVSSTTTLNGTTNGVTPAVDTNSVALATTAFVVGQAGSATPLVDGTAAVGTSLRYARQDHVHPTDTTRAPLASPSLTGTPLSTTAAADTNTTQIATTAFVVGQASSTAPVIDGTATVGTSLKYARADHVHPTDTSRAALASPTFTGTPSLPTGTTAITQSPGNNTTALATTAFVTAAVPAFATEAQLLACTSTTTAINPSLLRTAMSNAGYTTYSSLIGNYSIYQSGASGISIYSDYVSPYVNVANTKIGFSPSSALNVNSMQGRGTAELVMNWTKPMWFSYRFHYGAAIGSDANTICRVTIGKTASTFGDLSSRGFGIKWDGSTTGLFTVMAHNGTTLSTVASAVSVSTTAYFPTNTSSADFLVYSDGAGNVTLFCNNVQIATTTGGPSSGSGAARFIFETDNTTSSTGMCAPAYMGIRSHFAY